MSFHRRLFLQGLIGSSLGALAHSQTSSLEQLGPMPAQMPASQESGIEHIVVVMMENRSFDHFLGWLPNANGKQDGLSYRDNSGTVHSTYPLAPDFTGCGHPDPDHSYNNDRVAYNGGAMDGFLRAGKNDIFTIGYYRAADIPFYAALAQSYTAYDRWHAAILGPTFPNRMFAWAAQTDRLGDTIELSSLPTIFDRLASAGVSHRYYFNDLPYLAFWGLKYVNVTSLFSSFLSAAASGDLPAVSFIDPVYTIIDGTGNDDHPHSDIRNGDAFLAQVYNAVANGPKWANTVLIITFDEWGGFFEHVPPPRVIAPNNTDTDLDPQGSALLGFRVPVVIASPFTRTPKDKPNRVDSTLYDHTSVLKLIEWRWNLPTLTKRDASPDIGNPAANFNFTSPDTSLPSLPNPYSVFSPICFSGLGGGIFSSSARVPTDGSVPAGAFNEFANSQAVQNFLQHPRFQSESTDPEH